MDKEKIKNGIISAMRKLVVFVAIPIIVLMGIILTFIKVNNSVSAYSGDYDSFVNLGDYIVKTDEDGAMPAMTKEQLKVAIDKCYSGEMHENCISVLDDIVDVQSKYNVNAAFILAVAQKESTCGTGWQSIDSNSYNWMSISYGSTWNGDSGKTCSGGGYTWCWYDSYNEAVQKFGIYMTKHDSFYFGHGEYSVAHIAPHFAGTEWEKYVKEYLDNLYSAVAETLPRYKGSADGQAILSKAEEIMQKMIDEKYEYAWSNKVPMSKNGKKCDCSTFVCWVLYDLGYTNAQNNGSQLTTYDMDTNGKGYFANNGWTKITSDDDLQPGDIVIMAGSGNPNGHVQIFAYKKNGVNYYINCGWAPKDHTSVYETYQTQFYSAWRVPK